MKKQIIYIIIIVQLLSGLGVYSQNEGISMYFNNSNKKNVIITFKLINNLIVFPLKINNSNTLFFILDSGVKTPIITEISPEDSIRMNIIQKQKIQGLGDGEPVEVFYSTGNNFSIAGVISSELDSYVLENNIFHLSSKMGTKINGIIGYDVFNSFIVEIDYVKERIILHNPDFYKRKKYKRNVIKPLIIQNKKPYINAVIVQDKDEQIPVKLLVDTGSSLAIWLSVDSDERLKLPEKYEESFLGKGLNGDIFGKQGRIEALKIDTYTFNKPTTSYPNSKAIIKTIKLDGRNGSLGSEVLRRFRLIIDYHNGEIIFVPNHNLRDKFYYNMSGLEINMPYPELPLFEVSRVKEGSPADMAGIKPGDQLLSINSVQCPEMSLNEINLFFQSHPGRKITVRVKRNDEIIKTSFVLKQTL